MGVDYSLTLEDKSFKQLKETSEYASVDTNILNQSTLTIKTPVNMVHFPWFISKYFSADSIVYYPFRLGATKKMSSTIEYGWTGLNYPGGCVSPFLIIYDPMVERYTLYGATNWPPKKVSIYFSLGRVSFFYSNVKVGDTFSYMEVVGSSWQAVLKKYKLWLEAKLKQEKLLPDYPYWMLAQNGWKNVQLQNGINFNIEDFKTNYDITKSQLPWLQVWGQMSPYAKGCCEFNYAIDPRYVGLVEYMRTIPSGYYTRPEYESWEQESNYKKLADWVEVAKYNGASRFYFDIVGSVDLGPPLLVAKKLQQLPRETVIEFPTDIYPSAFLVSGSLSAPEGAGYETFPRLIRLLLNDRIMLWGESNGDWKYWPDKVVTEAFLLGCQFDVIHMNKLVEDIIALRTKHDWQLRDPIYQDTVGVSKIPDKMRITRFNDRKNKVIFCIYNPENIAGCFKYGGVEYNVPLSTYSIVERP